MAALLGLHLEMAMDTRWRFKVAFLSVCALTLALLPGCAVRNPELTDTTGYGDLSLTVSGDRSRPQVGEPVHIRFSIENQGRAISIESPATPVMDIVVEIAGGETLARWSEQNPDKVSHRLEWQPGESKVIEWTWTPKQGDIYIGSHHLIYLAGLLYKDGRTEQYAEVILCGSDVCRGN